MKNRFRHGICWILVSLALATASGCGQTAQLGDDPECRAATDALWTAVTAKRSDLLDASAARIDELHASQHLPQEAFDKLQQVVGTAHEGDWSSARVQLKALIRGQRPATRRD